MPCRRRRWVRRQRFPGCRRPAYYTLENSLISAPAGDPGKPGVERSPGGLTVRVFGRTPIGQPGLHTALAIEDPAEYAARSLREMLVARGVQVSGTARAQHRLSTNTSRLSSPGKHCRWRFILF